jgi:hypothetical protein
MVWYRIISIILMLLCKCDMWWYFWVLLQYRTDA